MSKKIYFGNKPLIIAEKITEDLKAYVDNKATVIMHEVSPDSINTMINELKNPETIAGIFLISNTETKFEEIKKAFNLIQAAGGAVLNKRNELLFIYRRGKWDLPKGKVDEGEELEACAIREVQEETGIQQINLKKFLCVTYHTYYEKEQIILKESFWYLLNTNEDGVLTPQAEEDIEKCEWVKPENFGPYLDNTHLSIIDVIKAAQPNIESKKA